MSDAEVSDEYAEENEELEAGVLQFDEMNEDDLANLEENEGEIDIGKITKKNTEELGDAPAEKKKVTRVMPKLDETRLTGDRGIGVLPKLFGDVQFKGKGHEVEDLNYMMGILEYWGHRMMPNMPFDHMLKRCQQLGNKRRVQVYRQKMRYGLPLLDDDFVSDKILEAEADEEGLESMEQTQPEPSTSMTLELEKDTPPVPSVDQLSRMEENRRKALELRKKRMQLQNVGDESASASVPDPVEKENVPESLVQPEEEPTAKAISHPQPADVDMTDFEPAPSEQYMDEDELLAEFGF